MSSEESCESIESCEDEEDGEGDEYDENGDTEEDVYDDECLIAERIIKAEENKAKNGLIAGVVCILLGVILSIIGVTGFINWSFAFGGINSSLTNAAPGVLLMIIGLLIIVVTNHRVIVQK